MHIFVCCLVGVWLAAVDPVQTSAVSAEPPVSPGENEWRFVDALAAPLTWHPRWTRTIRKDSEASLADGARVQADSPDPEGLLDTAYDDLNKFFTDVGLSTGGRKLQFRKAR